MRVFSPHKKGNFCKYSENIKNDFLSRLEWISARIRCFQVNPSGAPRQLPLHKGAMSRCDFRLCAAEKTEAKVKVSNPKTAEKRKSRALPQALRDSSLSEGAFVCACFFLCATEKTGRKFKASEPKVRTFFFCGSAVRHPLPFWEEGGTRERDGRSLRD